MPYTNQIALWLAFVKMAGSQGWLSDCWRMGWGGRQQDSTDHSTMTFEGCHVSGPIDTELPALW